MLSGALCSSSFRGFLLGWIYFDGMSLLFWCFSFWDNFKGRKSS